MMHRSHSRPTFCLVALLVILSISSCSPPPESSSPYTYPVDPAFSDFYRELGGEKVLGPAISQVFNQDGVTYQYILAGLLAYDPNLAPLKRFHFANASSSNWQINKGLENKPSDPNQTYVDGHKIWEEISSSYGQFGTDIIGLPLTGVVANDAKQRYEQYFEGLGFYRNYTAPVGDIEIMPYGSWKCGDSCRYSTADPPPPSSSYIPGSSATEQLFLQESQRLGYGYTGTPLSSPYVGSDGNFQMVFENVVLYFDPANGRQVRLRPLPAWLGIKPDQPVLPEQADWLTFYPTQGGVGYNVPKVFLTYINEHGGMEYSGDPITEYKTLADNGYSQCFTNICLEHHPTAPQELEIKPGSLGYEYFAFRLKSTPTSSSTPSAIQVKAWEEYPLINSGQRQTIYIESSRSGNPLKGIEISLLVYQPDGLTKRYALPTTGEDGKTSVKLDPLEGPNGSIVVYELCLEGSESPPQCFSRSYTIWDH